MALVVGPSASLAAIRKWVCATPEKSGSVTVEGGVLTFHNNGRAMGKTSFHTHPKTVAQGGYQPPSVRDLQILLNGALRGVVARHYVLCAQGMYIVTLKCNMSRAAFNKLNSTMMSLRRSLAPSRNHHTKWMDVANRVCPRCFNVKFRRWSDAVRL